MHKPPRNPDAGPLTPTVENYLKRLFTESRGPDLLPMGRVASSMGVTPGTATAMVKWLAESGLATYQPRTGVRLTPRGERRALQVIRRHRLVELFLVRTLGLDWSEVHAEAEELEHAISDKVLDRIDALLGQPRFDPHGDPIPTGTGTLSPDSPASLADCDLHRPVRIARITAQEPEFLQTLNRLGLLPGTPVVVESRDTLAGSVAIGLQNRRRANIGTAAAAKILVEHPKPSVKAPRKKVGS